MLNQNFFHSDNLNFMVFKQAKLVGGIELVKSERYQLGNLVGLSAVSKKEIKEVIGAFLPIEQVDLENINLFIK